MLHDALGVRDQAAVPSHASRNRRRYHAVVARNRAIGQSATTTSLPRAQHRVLHQVIRVASTIEEQFPRFVQTSVMELPTAARVVSSRLLHESLIFVFIAFSKIPGAVSQSSTCSKLKQTISDQRQSETSKNKPARHFLPQAADIRESRRWPRGWLQGLHLKSRGDRSMRPGAPFNQHTNTEEDEKYGDDQPENWQRSAWCSQLQPWCRPSQSLMAT